MTTTSSEVTINNSCARYVSNALFAWYTITDDNSLGIGYEWTERDVLAYLHSFIEHVTAAANLLDGNCNHVPQLLQWPVADGCGNRDEYGEGSVLSLALFRACKRNITEITAVFDCLQIKVQELKLLQCAFMTALKVYLPAKVGRTCISGGGSHTRICITRLLLRLKLSSWFVPEIEELIMCYLGPFGQHASADEIALAEVQWQLMLCPSERCGCTNETPKLNPCIDTNVRCCMREIEQVHTSLGMHIGLSADSVVNEPLAAWTATNALAERMVISPFFRTANATSRANSENLSPVRATKPSDLGTRMRIASRALVGKCSEVFTGLARLRYHQEYLIKTLQTGGALQRSMSRKKRYLSATAREGAKEARLLASRYKSAEKGQPS